MEEYAHRQNIERFERELRQESNPERRALLEQLLAEERAQFERAKREKRRR